MAIRRAARSERSLPGLVAAHRLEHEHDHPDHREADRERGDDPAPSRCRAARRPTHNRRRGRRGSLPGRGTRCGRRYWLPSLRRCSGNTIATVPTISQMMEATIPPVTYFDLAIGTSCWMERRPSSAVNPARECAPARPFVRRGPSFNGRLRSIRGNPRSHPAEYPKRGARAGQRGRAGRPISAGVAPAAGKRRFLECSPEGYRGFAPI